MAFEVVLRRCASDGWDDEMVFATKSGCEQRVDANKVWRSFGVETFDGFQPSSLLSPSQAQNVKTGSFGLSPQPGDFLLENCGF